MPEPPAAEPIPLWAAVMLVLWGAAIASQLAAAAMGALAARRVRPSRREPARNVEFVIVSRASFSVLEVLEETIERVVSMFPGYKVWVVVDEGSDGIPELRALEKASGGSFELVVVPSDYRKGAHKARAINYFIETRVRSNVWYVFLDDDSYPLDSRFLYELDEGRALVYVGILQPRPGRSLLAWLADAVRFHGEMTRNRFALLRLRKPVFGLHGELLIVHGSVLKEIGFETDSLAEDTWFAGRLIERGIPVTQSSSRVSVLSPNSVGDLWRQRARWNLGVLRDMVKGRYPLPLVVGRGSELALWASGPVNYILAGLVAKYYLLSKAPAELALPFTTAALLVILSAYTLYPTLQLGLRGFILSLALLPVTAFLESHSVIYALVNYKRFTRTFVVVDKRVRESRGAAAPEERPAVREILEGNPAKVSMLAAGEPGAAEIKPRMGASRLTATL